jgi:exosortase/archaeosortase
MSTFAHLWCCRASNNLFIQDLYNNLLTFLFASIFIGILVLETGVCIKNYFTTLVQKYTYINYTRPFEKFVDWRQCAAVTLLCLPLHNSGALRQFQTALVVAPS